MRKFFRPASLGFYCLMLLVFFVIGLYYAGFIDAGKGQGLAGGAIVLGYGVLFGGLALVGSIIIVRYVAVRKLVVLNWILLIVLFAAWGYKHYQFRQRDRLQEKDQPQPAKKPTTTSRTSIYFK